MTPLFIYRAREARRQLVRGLVALAILCFAFGLPVLSYVFLGHR